MRTRAKVAAERVYVGTLRLWLFLSKRRADGHYCLGVVLTYVVKISQRRSAKHPKIHGHNSNVQSVFSVYLRARLLCYAMKATGECPTEMQAARTKFGG